MPSSIRVTRDRKRFFIRSVLSILCLIFLCTNSLGLLRSTCAQAGDRQTLTDFRSPFYYSVDDWDDVPLFCCSIRSVQIWQDGRVAWRSGTGVNEFFKSRISQQRVDDALLKLTDAFKSPVPLERSNITHCSTPLIFEISYHYYVLSPELYKVDLWTKSIIDNYKIARKALQTEEPKEFALALRSVGQHPDYSFLHSYFHQYNIDWRYYSEGDLVNIGRIFVADAEFLLLFQDIINDLLPTDDKHIVSKQVVRRKKFLAVRRETMNGKTIYSYVPVLVQIP